MLILHKEKSCVQQQKVVHKFEKNRLSSKLEQRRKRFLKLLSLYRINILRLKRF